MDTNIYSVFSDQNYLDLGLYQFGYEKCKPSHSYGPAKRNHYLFHYVLSGHGTLYAKTTKGDSKTYHIRSNQGFLIFPNQETTYIADAEHPWEYAWLEFDGLRIFEMLKLMGLTWDNPVYHPSFHSFRDTARNELLYIVNHKDEPALHLIGHLYLFMDALIRSLTTRKKTDSSKLTDFYINEAVTFIKNHYHQDITIEDIANFCGLNRSYFGRLFKAQMGQSPQAFLMTYRMISAADMLLYTKMSIAEIGKLVGYENQLHFSRAFKNYYGISPMQWKKEHKNDLN